ncbi:hypothetical protein PsorP6_012415 [Peronosclerospora sorghi]|uniref:Uncharacterized protein n=1 Tax=Peronosclerospora sorghi TaxID=230839 RepID=A0ACC0WGP5_9STRA|nr:hypothetical protein PsorP6_012415 [Peronosclerospora sorghi]
MTSESLLLAARELVHGSMASLPVDVEVLDFSTSATHLAVLFRSRMAPNSVRLGVCKTEDTGAAGAFQLIDFESDAMISTADSHGMVVWSPDGKYLIVSGQIYCSQGEAQGVFWLVACSQWLHSTEASNNVAHAPLVLFIEPSKYLPAKQWNPATSFVTLLFPTQNGSNVLAVSADGRWLRISVVVAKLVLLSMEMSTRKETAEILRMKVVMDLSQWHAGITAVAYDSKSRILVISGGVRDPSVDLVKNKASSLSVWKIANGKDEKEPGELLDYTMILKDKKAHPGDGSDQDETEWGDLVAEKSNGFFASIKSALFAPFKTILGSETTKGRALKGSVRHVALDPSGNLVGLVDNLGRIAIRQIDACADVVKWQQVEQGSPPGRSTKSLGWLTPEVLALVLADNRVIYLQLNAHSQEDTSESENDQTPLLLERRLELVPARYCRPALAHRSDPVETLAFSVHGTARSAEENATCSAFEMVRFEAQWAANEVQKMELKPFIDLLLDLEQFDEALEVVAAQKGDRKEVSADSIHRSVWKQYCKKAAQRDEDDANEAARTHPERQDVVLLTTRSREALERGERDEFLSALTHLRAMSDKMWVLDECLQVVANDSSANMKKLLDLAWDALACLEKDEMIATEVAQHKVTLRRYIYRLETLRLVLCKEGGVSSMSVASDGLFDGASYALYRSAPIVTTAKQFAQEGRVNALKVVFFRHGWNVLPSWLEILELLPPSVQPCTYAALLPAIGSEDQLCVLKWPNEWNVEATDNEEVAMPAPLLDENVRYDLTDIERSTFNEHRSVPCEERYALYAEWYRKRILELDTRYGQLAATYELSQLASMCLSGWSLAEANNPLDELILHTERLYKCVYLLHLSSCFSLQLENWSALPIDEQARIVAGLDGQALAGDVTIIMDRLEQIFVATRRDRTYVLDELFSTLVQSMTATSWIASLTLATQIIERSKPSIDVANRWIQSNTKLMETALHLVYSVNIFDLLKHKQSSIDTKQCHGLLVEQFWTIFQSLPVRTEKDPPAIAQLHVAVDELEDFLIAMDVLSQYQVMTSPKELKMEVLASNVTQDTHSRPLALLEQMCEFAFAPENDNSKQWLDVLQDAAKLKEHAFGERWSQQGILDVVWKHLVASESGLTESVRELALHWIALDVGALDHVLDLLLTAIRTKLDGITGFPDDTSAKAAHTTVATYMNIIRELLALPVWDKGDRAVSSIKEQYNEALLRELETAHACELLDLLTHGAVKLSPAHFRNAQTLQEDRTCRLDAVLQVVEINPSHYKPSALAKEWLVNHYDDSESWSAPLAAMMQLAKLLRVDAFKLEIFSKGAYAALYCMDYEIALDMTMQVVQDFETANSIERDSPLSFEPLISLVVDLVSMSSFRSCEKKRQLCCALLSAVHLSSTDVFEHAGTDVILSWLAKIDVIQALMYELGLSDNELEQRRRDGGNDVETVLLNELYIVVELQYEKQNDRHFLFRLLQRGVELTVVLSHDIVLGCKHDLSEAFVQKMVQLCVQEATKLMGVIDSTAWRDYMELGCSYFMLWSDLCRDEERFQALCSENVLSCILTTDEIGAEASAAVIVRHLHHFFLLQALQAEENSLEHDVDSLSIRRERFELVSSCYERAQKVVRSTNESEERQERYVTYVKLAAKCQEWLLLHQKSQELDHLSSFLNTAVDFERFTHDCDYRQTQIMQLAARKDSFHLSRQFARKYGIDEYACVLTYIQSVLLAPGNSSMPTTRREELDHAFALDNVDLFEEALRRPVSFGSFLLNTNTGGDRSVYERMNGRDHVGLLLVVRMILECSKRSDQEAIESTPGHEPQLFPLSKASIDRLSLLFMCWKKLKEIQDALDQVEPVDFKLIGGAATTTELLTPSASDISTTRQVAIQAVRPLLTTKTIKHVTTILRKLHRVTSSSMVLIFLNDLLTSRLHERGASTTFAFGAYEACVPFLSVLSHDHLLLFASLFLDGNSPPALLAHLSLADEFYGQLPTGIQRCGALLTPQQRVDIVTKTLVLFQSKMSAWESSGQRSNVSSASSTSSTTGSWDPRQYQQREQERQYIERQLAATMCCFLLDEMEQNDFIIDSNGQSLETLARALRDWFALDQAAKAPDMQSAILSDLCQCVASIDLSTLIMEVVLCAGGTNATSDVAMETIVQSYKSGVEKRIRQCLEMAPQASVSWVEHRVWTWVTGASAPNCPQEIQLGTFLGAIDGNSTARALYERLVLHFTQSPSTLLQEIGSNRRDGRLRSLVEEAVLSEWEECIRHREEQHKWTEAAVLSHVLFSYHKTKSVATELAEWNFGLHVKAVWSALVAAYERDDTTDMLQVPTRDIARQFTAVFQELLACIEIWSKEDDKSKALRCAEQATVALSNLLIRYENEKSALEEENVAAWHRERERAVQTRIQAQFHLGTAPETPTATSQESVETGWTALLVRGVWGHRLLSWYTSCAFTKLWSAIKAIETVVETHWKAGDVDVAIQLLLMCPFDELRATNIDRLLLVVRDLPHASPTWWTAMELVLMRFDVADLLHYNLHSSIVAFVVHDESTKTSSLWTSTGAYVVCAFVTLNEFAAASRLTCALRHTHPLLWDMETSRFILATYLQSLSLQHKTSNQSTHLAQLEHDVYVQISSALLKIIRR